MSLHKISSIGTAALVLSMMAAGAAHAQTSLTPPYMNYAAKFSCGALTADADVVKGTYATSINIHNPQSTVSVAFLKKIVVALQEDVTPVGQIVPLQGNLAPDVAERVDCPYILKKLNVTTGHIEGFVVLEVPPISTAGGTYQPVLDVVAKYSARPTGTSTSPGSVSSFDVVQYQGQLITK